MYIFKNIAIYLYTSFIYKDSSFLLFINKLFVILRELYNFYEYMDYWGNSLGSGLSRATVVVDCACSVIVDHP